MLHKPPGLVSNMAQDGDVCSASLITRENATMAQSFEDVTAHLAAVTKAVDSSLNVVGRLDKESRGLLIFTTDGSLARSLIGEHKATPDKAYVVRSIDFEASSR